MIKRNFNQASEYDHYVVDHEGPTFFITPTVPALRQSSLYPPPIRVFVILPPTSFPHNSVMIIYQIAFNLYG